MLDKKGRIFGVVSVVDLFAVVALLGVFFAVFSVVRSRPALEPEQYVQISFFAPALHDFAANALELDTRVIDDDGGIFLGEVISIEITDSISFMPNREGVMVASHMQGHNAVTFTARVRGRMTDGAVRLGGRLYAVGDEVHLWAGGVRAIVHVSAIR